MPIKIVPMGEPIRVSTIITLLLGVPGIGKTTLANSAKKALMLDFDQGSHRSLNRPDTVVIETWADVDELGPEDLRPYAGGTLIVDTVGRCLDALILDIIKREPSLANAGTLKIQGYGRLKSRFINWLRLVRGFGINVVMVAHAVEEKHGDEVKLRVDGAGSGKEEVYKVADLMGRLNSRGGKRFIDWDPSDSGFGKNPAGLPAEIIPNAHQVPDYLQKCIQKTIDHLTQSNVDSNTEEQRLVELRKHFEDSLKGPDDFSGIALKMRDSEASFADRGILVSVAQERGYTLNKETLKFTDPKAAASTAEAEAEAEAKAFDDPQAGAAAF